MTAVLPKNMKITPEHYELLETAIEKVLFPEYASPLCHDDYISMGLSDRRWRWDLFN